MCSAVAIDRHFSRKLPYWMIFQFLNRLLAFGFKVRERQKMSQYQQPSDRSLAFHLRLSFLG